MTREEIKVEINHILVEQFELNSDDLKNSEAKFREDIDLDSLDAVDLLVMLEKKFKCRIPEEEAKAIRSLNQLYECIYKAMQV
jgi:acyl carrier protein